MKQIETSNKFPYQLAVYIGNNTMCMLCLQLLSAASKWLKNVLYKDNKEFKDPFKILTDLNVTEEAILYDKTEHATMK